MVSCLTSGESGQFTYALFLFAAQLEVFASLEGDLFLELARRAFHSQHDLLGRLGLKRTKRAVGQGLTGQRAVGSEIQVTHLLVENGLGLAAEALLLAVVSSLALSEHGVLALLVLGDLVLRVLLAALAVSLSGFRNVDL